MKEYYVRVPVELKGWQGFTVKARSEADAIAKIKAGKGQYDAQECECVEFNTEHAEATINE